MNRRKRKPRRQSGRTTGKLKLSEMIWEMAGDFVDTGETPEERESLLNAACSAWNIACASPDRRNRQLSHYTSEYLKFNPDADETEIAGVRNNLEKLVEKKLQMFPGDRRQIVGARTIVFSFLVQTMIGIARPGRYKTFLGAQRVSSERLS